MKKIILTLFINILIYKANLLCIDRTDNDDSSFVFLLNHNDETRSIAILPINKLQVCSSANVIDNSSYLNDNLKPLNEESFNRVMQLIQDCAYPKLLTSCAESNLNNIRYKTYYFSDHKTPELLYAFKLNDNFKWIKGTILTADQANDLSIDLATSEIETPDTPIPPVTPQSKLSKLFQTLIIGIALGVFEGIEYFKEKYNAFFRPSSQKSVAVESNDE